MLNYFNYFTEIEERFSQRKGGIHLLSTLDWALIEIWKDAGLPLEAVLRGIDTAFDRWERRPERHKVRRINSLAFCVQEVLGAAQEMTSANVGAAPASTSATGFDRERVAQYIGTNAVALRASRVPESAQPLLHTAAADLVTLSDEVRQGKLSNESVEQRLTVLEEQLIGALLSALPSQRLLDWRAEADREMSPYKRNMQSAQIAQLTQQFIHKRLLEEFKIPRLSLFYLF